MALSSQHSNDNNFDDQEHDGNSSNSDKNNFFIPTSIHYESVMLALCRSYHQMLQLIVNKFMIN